MPIVLARIDDRLIHGQVVTSWTRGMNINVIIIVDDDIAVDKMQLDVLKLTTPPGVQLFATSVDNFIERFKNKVFDKYVVMIVFKDPTALRQITEKGVKLDVDFINVGGIRYRAGRVQLTNAVSCSPQEIEDLLFIHNFGYKLEYRQVLTHESVNLVPILEKKKGEV